MGPPQPIVRYYQQKWGDVEIMGRSENVAITPAVLEWAIDESGLTTDAVAARARVTRDELHGWITGIASPRLGEFRRLASALKRPLATFLLPAPPALDIPRVSFRAPLEADRHSPSDVERTQLRAAHRLQLTVAWLAQELGESKVSLPHARPSDAANEIASLFRGQLEITPAIQLCWKTAAAALAAWRLALEDIGIVVLSVSMGPGSCRGFSIWDPVAPIIAINSAYRHEARIFTLFHECGHLITRTQSLCLESNNQGFRKPTDKTERWCEEFAASVILPPKLLQAFLSDSLQLAARESVSDLDSVYAVAAQFKVSARAAAIALIHESRASWELYRQIPRASDDKQPGFGRGGQTRVQRRESQVGKRTTQMFAKAVRDRLLSRGDAMSYLRVGDAELAEYWPESSD